MAKTGPAGSPSAPSDPFRRPGQGQRDQPEMLARPPPLIGEHMTVLCGREAVLAL